MNIKFFVHLIFSDDSVLEFETPNSAIDWLNRYKQSLETNPYGAYTNNEVPIQFSLGSFVSESQESTLDNRLRDIQLIFNRSSTHGRISS